MNKHFSYNNPKQLKQYLDALQKNLISRKVFYNYAKFEIKNKIVLEMGVRDGLDFKFYKQYAKELYGIEPDQTLYKMAQKDLADKNIVLADFHKTPFKNNKFEVIVSKYTISYSSKLGDIYDEVFRLLKPGGLFILLIDHPFRQYYERPEVQKNYFKKEIVHPKLFEGLIELNEYTYTFNDILSVDFLRRFKLEYYVEKDDFGDLSSEQIDNDIYPCFLLIKARKR